MTFMGELPGGKWILAGNLSGQHEYGMDQYRYDPQTGALVSLQNTPLFWEGDASISPEYLGYPVLAVASDFSPDGRYLAGTIGVDFGRGARRDVVLKIILIRLREPW